METLVSYYSYSVFLLPLSVITQQLGMLDIGAVVDLFLHFAFQVISPCISEPSTCQTWSACAIFCGCVGMSCA